MATLGNQEVAKIIDERLHAFTRSRAFSSSVREVIAVDKEVIRVLLENQELAGRIRDEVERRTTAVEAQLDGLRKEAAAGLLQRVPSAVAQEMVLQFPGFLQQNAQMERILQAHAHAIEQELEVRARDHLERILAEEKYHEVHQAYFAAFNRKGDQLIAEHREKWDDHIATQRHQNKGLREELARGCRVGMRELQTGLDRLQELQTQLGDADAQISALRSSQRNFSLVLVALGAVVCAAFFFAPRR